MSNALNYLITARRCESAELERLTRTCELVLAACELVHCLQEERGASNIFLASGGQRFADLRQMRMTASNAAQVAVCEWLAQDGHQTAPTGTARLYTRIAVALHTLENLPANRTEIDRLACTPAVATERYSRLIGTLLVLVFEAADVAVDPAISRLLIALFHLMQGKEFAGQERATGSAAFAAGRITAQQAHSIEYLIEVQEQSLQRFADFADGLRSEWQALQSTLPLADLERMRRQMLTAQDRPLDSRLADAWFERCSVRMDGLHQVETHLAARLQQLCHEQIAARQQELTDQEALFAALLDTAPLPPQAAFASRVDADANTGAVGPHLTQAVIDMLQTQTQRLQGITEELASARMALDERKLIERAKGILMATQGLSEEDAYRLLRQSAMNQNQRLADMAQAVLSLTEILPKTAK